MLRSNIRRAGNRPSPISASCRSRRRDIPEATASPGAVKAAPVCPRAQIQAAGERSRDIDVVRGGLAGVGPSRYCSPLWASQAFVVIQSCTRPQAGHTILAVTAGLTPPRHLSSINPREHVARVTTADNKEVGMGDLRGTEFSRRQAGPMCFFERRFTNKIDAT